MRPRRAVTALLMALVGGVVLAFPPIASASISGGTYALAETDLTANPGTRVGNYLVCPDGKRVVTGGAYWHRVGQAPEPGLSANVQSSAATFDAKGWYAAGFNYSTDTLQLKIYALCLAPKKVGTYKLVYTDFGVGTSPNTNGGRSSCGNGYRIVTGGAFWHRPAEGPDLSLYGVLQSSMPTSDKAGWYGAGANYTSQPLVLTVTALCLKSSSFGTYSRKTVDLGVTSNNSNGTYLYCKTGFRVVGGGAYFHTTGQPADPTLDAYLVGTSPTPDGRGWYAAGKAYQSGLMLRLTILCLKPT